MLSRLMIQVMSGSKRGTQLFTVMQRGDLVPHEVVLDILAQKMVETVAGANGFLIDGFPLDMEEANAFEKQVVPVTRLDTSSDIYPPPLLQSAVSCSG